MMNMFTIKRIACALALCGAGFPAAYAMGSSDGSDSFVILANSGRTEMKKAFTMFADMSDSDDRSGFRNYFPDVNDYDGFRNNFGYYYYYVIYKVNSPNVVINAKNDYLLGIYDGREGVYSYGTYASVDGSVTVLYKDVKPWITSGTALRSNANYYSNGVGKIGAVILHQYAVPYDKNPDPAIIKTDRGFIQISYRTSTGNIVTKQLPVVIETRNCEAWSNGRWRKEGDRWVMN